MVRDMASKRNWGETGGVDRLSSKGDTSVVHTGTKHELKRIIL